MVQDPGKIPRALPCPPWQPKRRRAAAVHTAAHPTLDCGDMSPLFLHGAMVHDPGKLRPPLSSPPCILSGVVPPHSIRRRTPPWTAETCLRFSYTVRWFKIPAGFHALSPAHRAAKAASCRRSRCGGAPHLGLRRHVSAFPVRCDGSRSRQVPTRSLLLTVQPKRRHAVAVHTAAYPTLDCGDMSPLFLHGVMVQDPGKFP